MIREKNLQNTAIFFRSLALFIILYQIRMIAADMADTPVFVTAILIAFASAALLHEKIIGKKAPGPVASLIIIILIPWLARLLIAAPGMIIRRQAASAITISLDSLLMNLDRNNFISLLPFYWAAVTTWFSLRSLKFLRGAVIADAALVTALYSMVKTADIAMYRWPVVMIIIFSAIVLMQALALLFSLPPELHLRKTEIIPAAGALLVLIFLGGALFLGPSQKRALEKGGGLLEPKLFSFDFSKYLRLDSEISMSDDLIMIVKKESGERDDHILLRRSVLSGYSSKNGFYRLDDIDEQTQPQRLPGRTTELAPEPYTIKMGHHVRQEYFLVNFDANALIAMNQPVTVTPYENWDASSFRSAFMVDSIASGASLRDLDRATANWPTQEELGLSSEEFKIYTEYGGDERIHAYAQEITKGANRYTQKVLMILNRLKYGEYRYSLKPGIAPDGDQLGWFLFHTQKGYCTYYAYAMTLMLRSLGIPARTAAGFFIDPDTNTFNYYPVRSDMAHAWVEVLFPGYGWIEFDPTTQQLAENEEFNFSSGVDPNLFERLMREILDNRSTLRAKEGRGAAETAPVSSLMYSAASLLKNYWYIPLLIIWAIASVSLRCSYYISAALRKDQRKKAIRLWKHCKQRLRLAGMPPEAAYESEWARKVRIPEVYSLYLGAAAARFAPEFTNVDFSVMQNNYRKFSAAYRQAAPLLRRISAWVLPFIALLLPRRTFLLLPVFLVMLFMAGTDTRAQETPGVSADQLSGPDLMFKNAMTSITAENWDQAIERLQTGEKTYPDDMRFPWTLGNLYHDRSLYSLAWDEFKKAETIDGSDEKVIMMLANTAGILNKSLISIEYYQKALRINPDNREAISNLGWMLYKVHRLTEGEKLLTGAIGRIGEEADFSMTLGTIYSEMYNYDKSKYWYQKAIEQGTEIGDMSFAAVAHYNLSILESRFYHYDLSMIETNASLNARRRASGLLARGELNMNRLELRQSQADYQAAYELDTSPLAKLNLAQIYQISGRLEEARLYAEDCLKANDHSWMLNYGIDPDRYKRDIHEILSDTYKGLAAVEAASPWARPGEKIRSLAKRIIYSFKAAVHVRLYEKYSLAAADSYRAELSNESPVLDMVTQYFNSFKRYPFRARTYLRYARSLETQIIPESEPSYDLDEGTLNKDIRALERALAGFDPHWEKILISQCYQEIAGLSRGLPRTERQFAAEELFSLNRGGLRQAGLALPVALEVQYTAESIPGAREGKALQKNLYKALGKTGFRIANDDTKETPRFTLRLLIDGSVGQGFSVQCELVDTQGAGETIRRDFPLKDFSRPGISDFCRTLGNVVFVVD